MIVFKILKKLPSGEFSGSFINHTYFTPDSKEGMSAVLYAKGKRVIPKTGAGPLFAVRSRRAASIFARESCVSTYFIAKARARVSKKKSVWLIGGPIMDVLPLKRIILCEAITLLENPTIVERKEK